jgi:Cu(I)/Ag(I) efflux system protein CusF
VQAAALFPLFVPQPPQGEFPMHKTVLSTIVLAASLASGAVLAQQKMDGMKPMDQGVMPAASAAMGQIHHATGVVKKVDPKTGLVTLAHEPVKSMNWPAMTMGFQVKDKMLLDKLSVGKKVDFDFEQGSNGYVVTAVK